MMNQNILPDTPLSQEDLYPSVCGGQIKHLILHFIFPKKPSICMSSPVIHIIVGEMFQKENHGFLRHHAFLLVLIFMTIVSFP